MNSDDKGYDTDDAETRFWSSLCVLLVIALMLAVAVSPLVLEPNRP